MGEKGTEGELEGEGGKERVREGTSLLERECTGEGRGMECEGERNQEIDRPTYSVGFQIMNFPRNRYDFALCCF